MEPLIPVTLLCQFQPQVNWLLHSRASQQIRYLLWFFLDHIIPRSDRDTCGKQTPGSRQKPYTAFGERHQNQLPTGSANTNSHPDAHGVVDRTATDHDEADFYEADGTQSTESRVYQQETDCTALNAHGHYIPSPYSSLSDAYPGSNDHQIDYGHCVGGGVGYSPSVYGETLSSVLGNMGSNGVIQPVETFASYST